MKNKIIFTLGALLICVTTARAETCTTTTTSTPTGRIPSQATPYIINCNALSYTNYYANGSSSAVYSTPKCTGCKSGYQLFTFYNSGTTGTDWTSTCESYNPSFTICAKPCDSNCVSSDNDWGTDAAGYECHQHKICKYGNKICDQTEFCRCDSGYYGYATTKLTGCTKCPSPSGCSYANSRQITNPDEYDTEITDCFVLKDSSCFSDSTGRYSCTTDAYYKE